MVEIIVNPVKKLLIGFNALLAIGFVGYVISDQWYELFPFHTIHSIKSVNSPVEGTPALAQYDISRSKICKALVTIVYANQDLERIALTVLTPGGALGIGQHRTGVFEMPGSNTLPAGRYCEQGYATNDCGLKVYTTPSPRWCFTVKPKEP